MEYLLQKTLLVLLISSYASTLYVAVAPVNHAAVTCAAPRILNSENNQF
jgi:hypothetical protein